MAGKPEIIDERIVKAVEDVLRTRMGRFGFRRARVRAGHDWMGEPALFIDADYDLVEQPLEPGATFGLPSELIEAFEQLGETRFPHVRHHFHERQKVVGDS